ncbi:hypothetical protein O9992_03110 [Vibrio lentus]|nr:hypothetical protein [Vibrio lentus]
MTSTVVSLKTTRRERRSNSCNGRVLSPSSLHVAGYTATLEGRLDAITFTGGIGENSGPIREMVLTAQASSARRR